MTQLLERLLATLDVRLHAFAVCEIRTGWRLVFDSMDAVIIHYVLAGTGALQTEGGAAFSFGPKSILIIPPGRKQSLSRPSGPVRDVYASEGCSLIADGLVKFDAGSGKGEIITICGTISATYGGAFGLFDSLSDPLVETFGAIEVVRTAFETMLEELQKPRVGTRVLTEGLMKQCLVLLLRQHFERQSTTSPLFAALQDQRLARAVAAVVERPGARYALSDLASLAGMSRSSFSERFSRTFGQSPLGFVITVRLRHAAHLLATTQLPVKLVADAVGYSSRSHFSREFKAAYGADPTAYRTVNAR
jgi:AraC-like DNA-binding protein